MQMSSDINTKNEMNFKLRVGIRIDGKYRAEGDDKMGHGHHEPFQIPKYTIYDNYKQFPELAAHEKRLAQIGLKDPWIR
ncbi:hypothetical protein ANCCAN_07547 [Ancylostoma caninum]|uniref:Uncharacterized protein n=1 Tax=Ancylostoma caninum TaxID=29170 RepID=A0A368GSV4_ANCCA|nr:hypothetical protein ANCCAN_07547 [Ancylostoma caninum]